ncbi:SDR family oxidoreductase [Alicyclobacillus sp. SO9]|uniref:SDR family oxidoreductase n=1 Tax=Alicyclobacillus sp. SO9 TaxID=2665646 RepID=UPI0018E8ED63|nr:SDR family oxidoreductase [Alicyclobacillus sp. SO9]QQE77987.1 SDR family oxidoreductase [Alicyclobacillus sp. SO9]
MKNKVAVITGASRGIGRNTAVHLSRQGTKVILLARNKDNLASVVDEIQNDGGEAALRQVDVIDAASVTKAFQGIDGIFGPVDVLINNAGSFETIGPVWEVDAGKWWHDFTVNVRGAFLCSKAVLPSMRKRNEGYIIHIVGGGTKGAFPFGSAYGSSKTALARLAETMAAELRDTGIRVFAIDPGLNDTDMTKYQRETELGKKYLPDMAGLFKQGVDESPETAPQLMAQIISGDFDRLSGRIFSVHDNLDTILLNLDDILDRDLYTLRSNELPDALRKTPVNPSLAAG